MEKKTILVTGSTDGIGRATAHALLRQGQRVIIHGRNAEKGHQVMKDLGRETGTEAVDLLIADLSSQEAIRRLSDEILSHHPLL
ncbi:MAG: SDR family NAD(P)-dependent oxidoreductase, partial [Methanomicrobiales archaeon]|nr:SDR family NAD(P)-dependent oxidoreductase [Methanomicrobiales archaeon]